jgi:outer membrane protein OmpA-like peptidoglycan-associated protein
MFEEADRETGYAIFIVVTLAIVVSLATLALAVGQAIGQSQPGPAARSAPAPSVVRIVGLVLFEVGKAEPPPDIMTLLAPTLRAARAMPGATVVISGYHDASGDAAANAELAKQRAIAVRDALAGAGIDERRLELAKPASTLGGADPEQARRVEITIR